MVAAASLVTHKWHMGYIEHPIYDILFLFTTPKYLVFTVLPKTALSLPLAHPQLETSEGHASDPPKVGNLHADSHNHLHLVGFGMLSYWARHICMFPLCN